MASVNLVSILGNMTRDVELRYLQSGTAVTEIGLALNHRYKKDNEWFDKPVFVDVTLWGRTAEIASEYLGKGSQVHIQGRLDFDQWNDKESGKKRSRLKIVCDKLTMVGSKGDSKGGNRSEYSEPMKPKQEASEVAADPDEEVPF